MTNRDGQRQAPGEDSPAGALRRRVYGRPTDRPLIPAGGGIPPIFRMIALFCMILVGVAGWFLMREKGHPADYYTGPGGEMAASRIQVGLADEGELLLHGGEGVGVFRFASNRRVLVLDFASLRDQGLTFNRIAALTEKIGLPKNRVLRDSELDAAIAASGDTMETYYLGHDYAAADLARFFALADRDGIALNAREEWLRRLLLQEGLLADGARGAVVSIPQAAAGHGLDAGMRAAILRHELSHAEFFTNAIYAEYVRRFWREGLGEDARAAFRRFFAAQGYDISREELMANEMQAYLMHTIDPRLFSAASLHVPAEVLHQWQAAFLLGMPNGWLRDAHVASLPAARPRPRRRQGWAGKRRRPRGGWNRLPARRGKLCGV